jgi:hypothetical protein
MDQNITEGDEGKRVVDSDGNDVGIVKSVETGTAYVDPDPGITDTVMSKMGWGDPDRETYPLDSGKVDTVTGDEIRLGD